MFGFMDKDEIKLFEKIISVSGMGAKAALSRLSVMEPSTFKKAIVSQDEKTLTTDSRHREKECSPTDI